MTPFRLKIVAPDKVFFDGETEQIIVKTTEGNVGILAHHAKYVANLIAGPLKIKQEDGTFRVAAISSGAISVGDNLVTIIVNTIEWADEIDIERAKRAEEAAREKIKICKSDKELDVATLKLKRALNRINIASK